MQMYFGSLAWETEYNQERLLPLSERIATVVILGRLSLIVLAVACGDVCLGDRLFARTL